jgi:hypothetical protein
MLTYCQETTADFSAAEGHTEEKHDEDGHDGDLNDEVGIKTLRTLVCS